MEKYSYFKGESEKDNENLKRLINDEIAEKTKQFMLALSKYEAGQEREDQELNIASQADLFNKDLERNSELAGDAELAAVDTLHEKQNSLQQQYLDLTNEYTMMLQDHSTDLSDDDYEQRKEFLKRQIALIDAKWKSVQKTLDRFTSTKVNPLDN